MKLPSLGALSAYEDWVFADSLETGFQRVSLADVLCCQLSDPFGIPSHVLRVIRPMPSKRPRALPQNVPEIDPLPEQSRWFKVAMRHGAFSRATTIIPSLDLRLLEVKIDTVVSR